MSVIRRRKPRFEYVQMLNAVVRDYRVSWRARGLLTELLSYPEGYETTVDELVKKAKRAGGNVEGRDAMRAAARELKNVGYIVEIKHQNELGHWITEQEVTDDPMYDLLSQEAGISAGRTDDGFPGVGSPGVGKPGVGSPGVIRKTEKKKEGEEGDARGRASDVSSPGDNSGQWAVRGERDQKSSLAAADLIRAIAKKVLTQDEGLTVDEFQLLARLADEVRPVVDAQPALGWDEYVAWLYQGWVRPDGRKSYKTFSGALRWRLLPEQVQKHAVPWAVDRRAAQAPSEAHGGREKPDLAAKGAEGAMHETRCAVHGTMTMGGRCQPCDRQAAEEERRYQEEQQAAEEAAAAEAGEEAPVSAEDDAMVAKMIEELHRTREAATERARKEKEATRAKLEALRKGAEKETLQRAL